MDNRKSQQRFIRRWRTSDFAPDRRGFEASFLESVCALVPELTSSLKQKVLPIFEDLQTLADKAADPDIAEGLRRKFEIAGEPAPLIGVLDASHVQFSARPFRLRLRWSALKVADERDRIYPDFVQLRIAMEEWADRFGMAGCAFFLDSGLVTLGEWSEHPHLADYQSLALRGRAGFCPVSRTESRFAFERDGWDPAFERFSTFEDRLRKQFDYELSIYRSRLEELTTERGHLRVPDLHRVEHIQWLALFQCGRWSLADITKR